MTQHATHTVAFRFPQVNRLISDANEISDEPYGKLKQRDLKERCTRYGLPTNGGKKALVARLEAHRTDKKSEANNARFQMKQDLVSWTVICARVFECAHVRVCTYLNFSSVCV